MKFRHAVLLTIGWLPVAALLGQDGINPLETDPPPISADAPATKANAKTNDSSAGAKTADQPEQVPGRVIATMLLVKSDWSEVPGTEKIEAELETLLKGSSLDSSYRNDLLASGPKILFSDQFVSLYDRERFAALLAWLGKHELVRDADIRHDRDAKNEMQLDQWNAYHDDTARWSPIHRSAVFGSEESMPFPIIQRTAPPPFVSYTYGWSWTFASRVELKADGTEPVVEMDIVRAAQRRVELKTPDAKQIERHDIGRATRLTFNFPADRVAVVNGFHSYPSQNLVQVKWIPVVYFVPESLPLPLNSAPALAAPASLIKVSTAPRSRFEPTRSAELAAPSSTLLNKPTPTKDTNLIKVFVLKFVEASEVANTLTQLVPDGRFVADERLNSIIVRADGKQLEMVEALLRNLDAQQRSAPGSGPLSEAQQRAKLKLMLPSLRGRFESAEEQTRSLAEAIVEEKDANAIKKLREQLTLVVAEAFGLRQELQKAEVALLRERIHHIESRVNQREMLRDEIIRHRVDQLVSREASPEETLEISSDVSPKETLGQIGSFTPNRNRIEMNFDEARWGQVLRWFADLNGVALQLNHEPAGFFSYHSPRRHTLEEARAAIVAALPPGFELLQNEGQLISRRRPDQPTGGILSVSGVTTLRGPDEYRQSLEDVNTKIEEFDSFRYALEQQNQPSSHWADAIAKLQNRLEMLTAEYAAQVRLFELETEAQMVALQTAKQTLDRTKMLYETGVVSSSELGQATVAYEQARVKLDQTNTLLDLYRQAGQAAKPVVGKSKRKSAAAQSPDDGTSDESNRKGATIEALPDDGVLIVRGEKKAVQDVLETIDQVRETSSERAGDPDPANRNASPE